LDVFSSPYLCSIWPEEMCLEIEPLRFYAEALLGWRSVSRLPSVASQQPPESESFKVDFEQEKDGRWLAEIAELPGVMAYGATKRDAEVAAVAGVSVG
jgi:hypothetical protein